MYNKYSVSILLPKAKPEVMEFAKWLKEAVTKEALAIAGQAGLKEAMGYFTNFKDGDNVSSFKTYRGEYAGHFVLNVGRKTEFGKPCVVNRDKQPIDPSEVYAGCNIVLFIDVYGYKYGAKKSVSIGFQHVLKAGENTPFSSTGTKVDDAFEGLDLPEETDEAPAAAAPATAEPGQPAAAKPPADPFTGV